MLARFRTSPLAFLLLFLFSVVAQPLFGQRSGRVGEITAADVFPGSTAIYAEIENPAGVLEQLKTHSVVDFIKKQKEYEQYLATPEMAGVMIGLKLLETQLGEPIERALAVNMGRGVFFGFDTKTKGVALLFRSSDEAKLKKMARSVLNLIDAGAKDGNNAGFQRKDYRDAKVAKFDEILVARYKDWLLVTNKKELAKEVVDNLHDGTRTSLASQNWFVEASRQKSESDRDAWAAVDLKTIRMAGVARELFTGKTDNPGIELVVGGVLDALKNAPVATAEVSIGERLEVSVMTPFDHEWANSAREFFYGSEMTGRAPAPLRPKKMIASLTTHRDLGEWWLAKEDLFDENVIAQLAQADSQFSTIFSGLDFGEQVLGSLEPEMQIVVAENTFEPNYQPDIKLPAFAMVSRLKDVDNIQRRFKIAFQSVIGFANINLGMQGQPQLDLETEKMGEARVSSATYMFDGETAEGLLLFNFGPTIAFQGSYFIVSSNRHLAVELAELAAKRERGGENGDAHEKRGDANTRIVVDGVALQRILADNREPLIANNMLEEGNSRADAEQAIGTVLRIAELVKSIELDFTVGDDQMKFDFGVEVVGAGGE